MAPYSLSGIIQVQAQRSLIDEEIRYLYLFISWNRHCSCLTENNSDDFSLKRV